MESSKVKKLVISDVCMAAVLLIFVFTDPFADFDIGPRKTDFDYICIACGHNFNLERDELKEEIKKKILKQLEID
jgi:hypothetical protein